MKECESNYIDLLNFREFDNFCITDVKLFLQLLDSKIENFNQESVTILEKLIKEKYLTQKDLTILHNLEQLIIIVEPLTTSTNEHKQHSLNSVTSIIYHYVQNHNKCFDKYKNFIINHSKAEKEFWDRSSAPKLFSDEENIQFFETTKSIINQIKQERAKFENLLEQKPAKLYKLIITKTIIDQISYDKNLMMISISNNDIESFKKLLFDYGANIYIEGHQSIFHHLLQFHHIKSLPYFNLTKELINQELLDFKNNDGKTLFDIAIVKDQKEMITIFVAKGAKVPSKLINQVKSFIEQTLDHSNYSQEENYKIIESYVKLIYTRNWHQNEIVESFIRLLSKQDNALYFINYAINNCNKQELKNNIIIDALKYVQKNDNKVFSEKLPQIMQTFTQDIDCRKGFLPNQTKIELNEESKLTGNIDDI